MRHLVLWPLVAFHAMGCSTLNVQTRYATPTQESAPAVHTQTPITSEVRSSDSLFWGLIPHSEVSFTQEGLCSRPAANTTLKIYTSAKDLWISLLTLGVWNRRTVQISCSKQL
jgi:hypothetical protein